MTAREVLHIDFDSFFASVEQQYDPSLRNKPIGVTASNGRNCIIATSREAKKFGVKTGTTRKDAYMLCPRIQLLSADFTKYWEVSKKFISICKDFSPFVEVFSIDELFMDITPSSHLFGGPYGVIEKIRKRIDAEIGQYITVSVGLSYNKLLAKLASGLDKPNGLVKIDETNLTDVYQRAKLTDICGIGDRIAKRLRKIGVYTLLNLGKIELSVLMKEFGPAEAEFLHNVGQGFDSSPVIPYTITPDVKSVGRNYCLPQNEYNKRLVLQNIYELCEEVGIKLRRLDKNARRIGIFLRGNINMRSEHTFGTYLSAGYELFDACLFLIGKDFMYHSYDYVRQIGVWASRLEDVRRTSHTLFENGKRKNKLTLAVDKLNERFGHHTIRNGFLLYADKLTTVPNGYLADRFERRKLARESF